MHPILIKLGNVHIYSYGFFIAMGILAGMWVAAKYGKKEGIEKDLIMDITFYAVISAIIGARIFYVILNFEFFKSDILGIFKIWEGGLVFYGGLIAGTTAAITYIRMNKLSFAVITDLIALAAPLAHAIGRLGCFAAGCCYGNVCHLPWAVQFTNPDTLAQPIGLPLHPTQLYSSIANLMIFFIILTMYKKNILKGKLLLFYIFIYGITRSILEIYRGDDERGTVIFHWLSTSQAIGITAAMIAICILLIQKIKTND